MLIAFNVTEISKYDLRPAVFKFLVPQKIEDSTTVTWVYTNNATSSKPSSKEKSMCETPQRLGFLFKTTAIQWNLKVLLFGFHGINTKPKYVSFRDPIARPSDCRVSWTKEQTKQDIYTKIGRFQFSSFLGIYRNDSCQVEITWGVHWSIVVGMIFFQGTN